MSSPRRTHTHGRARALSAGVPCKGNGRQADSWEADGEEEGEAWEVHGGAGPGFHSLQTDTLPADGHYSTEQLTAWSPGGVQ